MVKVLRFTFTNIFCVCFYFGLLTFSGNFKHFKSIIIIMMKELASVIHHDNHLNIMYMRQKKIDASVKKVAQSSFDEP